MTRLSNAESMPLGPGYYLPCGLYFDADYLALAHRMDGCDVCDADALNQDEQGDDR